MKADRYGSLWLIIVETVVVAVEVLLQKFWMFRLPALQQIGLDENYSDSDICDKVCIITGPTSGIGTESAKEMWRRGWHVVLACRNEAKGKELAKELRNEISMTKQTQNKIEVQVLDVSSLASVRAFALRWKTEIKLPVHVLINNAGIFSMSAPRQETEDGFESHIGTNYLGHFLLAELMRPWMIKAQRESHKPARIVNVSSKLHRMGKICQDDPHLKLNENFNSLAAYSQSKLAQVMFAKECNKKFDGVIRSVSVHPGEVLTDVVRSLPSIIQKLYKLIMQIFLLTPSEGTAVVSAHVLYLTSSNIYLYICCHAGARSTVFSATSPSIDKPEFKNIFYVDSDCRPGVPNQCVYNDDLSSWLWEWSCQMVLPNDHIY